MLSTSPCSTPSAGEQGDGAKRTTSAGSRSASISNFFGPMTAGIAIDTVGFNQTFLLGHSHGGARLAGCAASFTHTPPSAHREAKARSTFEPLQV
jgi:hypothetical protein